MKLSTSVNLKKEQFKKPEKQTNNKILPPPRS